MQVLLLRVKKLCNAEGGVALRETDAEPGNRGGGSGWVQAGADPDGIWVAELFYEQSEDGSVQGTAAGPGVGMDFTGDARTVDAHIRRLRGKMAGVY